jgi:hypothetical protein
MARPPPALTAMVATGAEWAVDVVGQRGGGDAEIPQVEADTPALPAHVVTEVDENSVTGRVEGKFERQGNGKFVHPDGGSGGSPTTSSASVC